MANCIFVDQLIRDVHISFIRYVESMLEESSNTVAAYWSNVLKTIEPTVVQIFHHIEAVFVSATKHVIRESTINFFSLDKLKKNYNNELFIYLFIFYYD